MGDALVLRGELLGHTDWVTAIATSEANPGMLVTGSRDNSLIVWNLVHDGESMGSAQRRLTGHKHNVSDVTLSSDGSYALSSSWDGTLRLWEIATGETARLFSAHTKDVLSVAFSQDNRQIVSSGRDKTIRLWNTIGECKATIEGAHADWVSCVRFSPGGDSPVFVSAGWDKKVKVWTIAGTVKPRAELAEHNGYLSTVTVSPDGSLCASGGKDGVAMLWDLNEGKLLYKLESGSIIHSLCFSPNRYWLCAATSRGIVIWDLESKAKVAELNPVWEEKSAKSKALSHFCTSLAWSADGATLYAGYTDNAVRVWAVSSM